jgi:hypothetical protein
MATVPTLMPDKGGGIPFINSNPAVPLPTGEIDSATIRPLPTSGHHKLVYTVHLSFYVYLLPCFDELNKEKLKTKGFQSFSSQIKKKNSTVSELSNDPCVYILNQ